LNTTRGFQIQNPERLRSSRAQRYPSVSMRQMSIIRRLQSLPLARKLNTRGIPNTRVASTTSLAYDGSRMVLTDAMALLYRSHFAFSHDHRLRTTGNRWVVGGGRPDTLTLAHSLTRSLGAHRRLHSTRQGHDGRVWVPVDRPVAARALPTSDAFCRRL